MIEFFGSLARRGLRGTGLYGRRQDLGHPCPIRDDYLFGAWITETVDGAKNLVALKATDCGVRAPA